MKIFVADRDALESVFARLKKDPEAENSK